MSTTVITHTEKRAAGYLQITLRDGTTYRFEQVKLPRHWKSWLMQQVPYGTDFMGCRFEKGRL